MRLTVEDIKRAITAAGNINSFSELYYHALGCPPLKVTSRLDIELPLPSPAVLLKQIDPVLTKIITEPCQTDTDTTPPSEINLNVVAAPVTGQNLAKYLKGLLEKEKPDIIALNLDPLTLSAEMRYAFSLPCAVGFAFSSDVKTAGNREIYFKRRFTPAGLFTQTILNGWLMKIPVLPLGKRPAGPQLTFVPSQGYVDLSYSETARWDGQIYNAESELDHLLRQDHEAAFSAQERVSQDLLKYASGSQRGHLVEESCYFISRLIDVLIFENFRGRIPRVLAISDLAHFQDIKYLGGLLKDGITDEIYVEAKTPSDHKNVIMDGLNQAYSENEALGQAEVSGLFLGQLNYFVENLLGEIISDAQSLQIAVEISEHTRRHPDIVRGVSVRGSIAMIEVLRSLALLRGHLTREAVGRAALITLTPRLSVKGELPAVNILEDILKEVFYDFSFSSDPSDSAMRSIWKLTGGDIMDKLNQMGKLPQENSGIRNADTKPLVFPESESNKNILKKLEQMDFLKKGQNGQYSLTRKALQTMLDQLDQKMKANEITTEEYNRQKAVLQSKMKSLSQPRFKMSSRDLADTIMELIDAQDGQWNKEISFQTMRTYYHIKENSDGVDIGEYKRDYYSLQKLIDDLEKRKILGVAGPSSGMTLTGLALDMLLKYFVSPKRNSGYVHALTGKGKALSDERSQEVRRFSSGDAFRDIAVRPTLREIARQKRKLKDIRKSDLKVFLKQPRQPQSDIMICMDTSGSMGFHQKLMYARLVAAGLIQSAIREKNRIGLVAFNDSGQVTLPLTATHKEALLNCVAGLNARGNTNIGEGIKTSRNMLFKDFSSNQKHIILISDGQPTALSESAYRKLQGHSSKDLTEESAILETRLAARRGIQLSVVHIAGKDETNEKFIKDIARAGQGKIRRISGPEDLRGIMN